MSNALYSIVLTGVGDGDRSGSSNSTPAHITQHVSLAKVIGAFPLLWSQSGQVGFQHNATNNGVIH